MPIEPAFFDIVGPITNYLSQREHTKIEEAREKTEREKLRTILKAYTAKLETDRMNYECYLKTSLSDRNLRCSMVKDFLDENRDKLNDIEKFAMSVQMLMGIINMEEIQPPNKLSYNIDHNMNSKYLEHRDFNRVMLE
ncbi:hypothetical protein [Vallitalea guaymasensis]|uniref:hypothetical protein n=1 Tax=Vallitalea guaymasensis TaxID=1185412 RepID=UPI000DE3A13E|nr:hypothetical protein [Vallitalea guaymasensis]